MAIDTSLIQDTDWLACTDDNGITYKVSGAAFKELFKEPAGISGTIVIPTDGFEFYITTSQSNKTVTIDWGDGSTETLITQSNNPPHTYASAGTYTIKLTSKEQVIPVGSNSVTEKPSPACWTKYGPPDPDFVLPAFCRYLNYNFENVDLEYLTDFDFSVVTDLYQGWSNCYGIDTVFPFIDTSNVTGDGFVQTWYRCENMIGPFPLLDTSGGEDFTYTWKNCENLSGDFPLIDLSNATKLQSAWENCEKITSFPKFDLSKVNWLSYTWNNCKALGSFPEIETGHMTGFSGAWFGCSGLTSFPLLDSSNVTNFSSTWQSCSNLTDFPLMDFSSAKNIKSAWYLCTGLTSFPSINTSNVTDFSGAWYANNKLTSFPAINTSNGEMFTDAWNNCQRLTSFPVIDVSKGTNFNRAWFGNQNLTSFPAITFDSGTSFFQCWDNCFVLVDFPPNAFDVTGTLAANAFTNAFGGGSLTAVSIENILVSLDTNGQSNITLQIYGAPKSTWTTAANTAYDSLITKGWTITYIP